MSIKKNVLVLVGIALLAVGCNQSDVVQLPPPSPVACTQEAKVCPDGSAVGRTGPQCEFAACPGETNPKPAPAPLPVPPVTSTRGTLVGTVTMGPSCPVQRFPPESGCEDKPYVATVQVKTADGKKQVTEFTSGKDGKFTVSLAAGKYLLVPIGGAVYPRAGTQEVVVESNKTTVVDIMFDSGIR